MSYDYERMWREDSVLTSVGYTWTNTTEWKEVMKKEINRLIDTGILNPETIVSFGYKDFQELIQVKQKLTTDGVRSENVTCELHNSQATTPPSACDEEQLQLDVTSW